MITSKELMVSEFVDRASDNRLEELRDAVLYYKGKRVKFMYVPEFHINNSYNELYFNGIYAEYDDVRDTCYTYKIVYQVYVSEDFRYGCVCETEQDKYSKLETLSCEVDAENYKIALDKFKRTHPLCKKIISVTQREIKE